MTATTGRIVGVDLQDSEDNRAVIDAIEADNSDVKVTYLPGLVKLSCPGELVVRRSSVEERLGRQWETPEFQMAIVSYIGGIAEWDDDHLVIRWEH